MSEENVDKVRRGYDAFNRRDFDAALSDVDESVTWRPIFSIDAALLEGTEEVRASFLRTVESLDLRIEVEELIPVGDETVVAIAKWTGRGSGSGTPVGQTAVQVFTLEDGRLVKVESHLSKREALEAAGLRE